MRISDWSSDVCSSDLLDIASAPATLDVLDELRAAIAAQRDLQTRIDGIARDAREHDESVAALTERLGIAASGGGVTLLEGMRARLSAARSTARSEEHTSELQSLMRISYAVFCLKKKIHSKSKDTDRAEKTPSNTNNRLKRQID